MLYLFQIISLLHFYCILVESSIHHVPDLIVTNVDNKVIQQKRQDTLDMCRIFTEESKKDIFKDIENGDVDKTVLNKYSKGNKHRRSKRDIARMSAVNPSLNPEDERRVENVIDRMYDDLLEKGHNIPYRRKQLSKTSVKGSPKFGNASIQLANETGRRFNFMPAILEGPTSPRSFHPDNEIVDGKRPRFKHGIIPYFIDSKTYDSHLADIIMKAFEYFEKATCIRLQRLRERPTDLQSLRNVVWLYITNPSGIRQCVHSNDRVEIKGVQMIVFGYDCMALGDITHEVMHVLGFSHEHTRPDRDQYITILWDNIKPGYRKFFEVEEEPVVQNLPYDYASVLHYPPRAFSRNGQVTILTEPGIKVGQREGLSEMDVEKIGALYSTECVKRNREYLLKTCPSVVKADLSPPQVSQQEIEDYFQDRLWPFGVVNYKFKDIMEFSTEEMDNIKTVIRHIEKETCIEFRDLTVVHNPGDTSSESDTTVEDKDNYVILGLLPNETKKPLPNFTSSEITETDTLGPPLEVVPIPMSGAAARRTVKPDLKPAKNKTKKVPPTPGRRHAENVLVLARSAMPGCACPRPGNPDGKHVLRINADCFNSVNDLLHVFVHILGLDHQHNMHDRDSYLHIVWDQLTEGVRKEMKQKLPPAASVGFGYDYQSVMHYPWLQIKNGRTNIMYPIWNDGWAMGHWQGLSSVDVQKLNMLYFKQCVERKQQALQAESLRRG